MGAPLTVAGILVHAVQPCRVGEDDGGLCVWTHTLQCINYLSIYWCVSGTHGDPWPLKSLISLHFFFPLRECEARLAQSSIFLWTYMKEDATFLKTFRTNSDVLKQEVLQSSVLGTKPHLSFWLTAANQGQRTYLGQRCDCLDAVNDLLPCDIVKFASAAPEVTSSYCNNRRVRVLMVLDRRAKMLTDVADT